MVLDYSRLVISNRTAIHDSISTADRTAMADRLRVAGVDRSSMAGGWGLRFFVR
jgi:hypothetical protein